LKHTIDIGELGRVLGLRVTGEKIRKEIEEKLKNNEIITINFKGVEVLTNCFADECFGKLVDNFESETLNKLLIFNNIDKFVEKSLKLAIKERKNKINRGNE
jgi:hypothetical protein